MEHLNHRQPFTMKRFEARPMTDRLTMPDHHLALDSDPASPPDATLMNPLETADPFASLAEAVSLSEAIRTLDEAGNRVVRSAIRNHFVTFPSEVPIFKKSTRPDLQAKIAVLYFVRGWSTVRIGKRYKLGRQRVTQILTKWRVRAVRQGFIQLINETTVVPMNFLRELRDDLTGEANRLAEDKPEPSFGKILPNFVYSRHYPS